MCCFDIFTIFFPQTRTTTHAWVIPLAQPSFSFFFSAPPFLVSSFFSSSQVDQFSSLLLSCVFLLFCFFVFSCITLLVQCCCSISFLNSSSRNFLRCRLCAFRNIECASDNFSLLFIFVAPLLLESALFVSSLFSCIRVIMVSIVACKVFCSKPFSKLNTKRNSSKNTSKLINFVASRIMCSFHAG